MPRPSTKQLLTEAIRDLFKNDADRAEEIIDADAFGALVCVMRRQCEATDEDPRTVLDQLSGDDVEFAADGAENPAAFLAARVRDL